MYDSFEVKINLINLAQILDCIAIITEPTGKILFANEKAEKLFPSWQDKYLIDYTDYNQAEVKKLYDNLAEKNCIFNIDLFFSGSGQLVYLEILALQLAPYYFLLATENPTKIEYLNRITTLTGEINILNQKLSKKNQEIVQSKFDKIQEPKPNTSTTEKDKLYPQLADVETTKKIIYSGFEICAVTRKVTVNDKNVRLTAREFELLWLMASHPNQIFTRNYLLTAIWEADYSGDDNTVTVHIRRLRKKIEDNPNKPRYIKTIWGVGYRFELPQ